MKAQLSTNNARRATNTALTTTVISWSLSAKKEIITALIVSAMKENLAKTEKVLTNLKEKTLSAKQVIKTAQILSTKNPAVAARPVRVKQQPRL